MKSLTIYQETAQKVQQKLHDDLCKILLSTGKKGLKLTLGQKNLLENGNVVQSSTAIGFCVEEFVSMVLVKSDDFYKRNLAKTQNSSYDLYAENKKIQIMINIKTEKKGNYAIAALNRIIKDYVEDNPQNSKLFLIVKLPYKIRQNKVCFDKKQISSYFLEQIYFNKLKKDNRSWSKKTNPASGRIQYKPKKYGLKSLNQISYIKTIKKLNNYRQDLMKKLLEKSDKS